MNVEKAKMSWAETLNTVARGLDAEPQSVKGLAEKIGINRTKTRDALGVLEHDGVAIEMLAGWIHADKKNGRESLKEGFARRVREHPLLGPAEKLLHATMIQFMAHADESSITFSAEMLTTCDAYVKAVLGGKGEGG